MARFNIRAPKPAGPVSPVTTAGPRTRTHLGGKGHARDDRSELFLLAVADFVSQQTHHESGTSRDDRFVTLVRKLAVEDPSWTAGLLAWLRGDGRMRTASLVGAADRHTFGGLTDAAFRMVPLLESGRDAHWPWED
ncbi:hypothetical protein AF335_19700 [Streptomyces eurocidicus]|uniref:TROVE domain-containing protein n=1 Tax=Streptomyces eurocidicus TaxID=66423 RepID=A0A2N8NTC6_STREU|nr:hypothetical protein [Streptomyces eurocidicus]MBF6055659.1 hypothetical protein [Streptomyces eurocidicus]PNE32002.1 hypothetical protein AF335_19700 [Streptomyces eurocidicus]